MFKQFWRVTLTPTRWLTSSAEAARSTSTKKSNQNPSTIQQVCDHLQSSKPFMTHYSHFSPSLLRMRPTKPTGMYCMSDSVAETIFQSVKDHLVPDIPIVELNPGLGLLTRSLLTLNPKLILAYESDKYFRTVMNSIAAENCNVLKVQRCEFLKVWKEAFKDKLDGGSRVDNFFPGVEKTGWDSDPFVQIIGVIPNPRFFQCMVNSIAFQSGIITLGRPELYLVVPPEIFWHINCETIKMPVKYSKYILFNMFFDCELLNQVDGKCFLPWFRRGPKKTAHLRKYAVNRENYYLMKAVPKRDLFKVIPPELLTSLWFFIYQATPSTKNKVILYLERWIPGCGPLFIAKGLTVFTEFRDLKYNEMLDVFLTFVSLPEFEDCSFHSAKESFLNKSDEEALADFMDFDLEDAEEPEKVSDPLDTSKYQV